MLVEWNATAAPVPAEPTLHAWFLAQAARTPHAPAIRTEAGAWTYGELAAFVILQNYLISRTLRTSSYADTMNVTGSLPVYPMSSP